MRRQVGYSLSTQFLAAAAIVLCLSMAVLGTWVNHRITRSVLATSGADGAAFMRGVLEQHVQRIGADGTLHPDDVAILDRMFIGTVLGEYVVSVKLWSTDGSGMAEIIYSSMTKDSIGERYVSSDVVRASRGLVVSEFEDMISEESTFEQGLDLPLIEIYSPLYRKGTNEVLAVGEVYEDATTLAQQLSESVVRTWLVVCLTTVLMIGVLYLIVRRGNRLINQQQSALSARVHEAQLMASQNHGLRLEAERSRLDANEANEELLARIGMDIHDGPIQLLTLVRLRLDEAAANLTDTEQAAEDVQSDLGEIGEKLSTIIDELRDLSVGLVLPELSELSLRHTIELAIERHEQLTGTVVAFDCGVLPSWVAEPLKTCIYRIVQESLANAFKHAGGHGQQVMARADDHVIELEILDNGPALQMAGSERADSRIKLGQRGIRNRVTAFSGAFSIEPRAGHGTRVFVAVPYQIVGAVHSKPKDQSIPVS